MFRQLSASCAATVAIGLPQLAIAALPKSQAPSRGEGTNILQTIQNWGFDGFMLIGLIIVGVMFLGVSWHAFGVYHEIHDGKKKWRDLGATATVGVGILAVGIFLVTQATGIL